MAAFIAVFLSVEVEVKIVALIAGHSHSAKRGYSQQHLVS